MWFILFNSKMYDNKSTKDVGIEIQNYNVFSLYVKWYNII